MNREQQSFGASGGELRTLLFVLLAVVLGEALLRSAENMLSGNIAHINEIPHLVEDYDSSRNTSFIFLGNSLTNNAIDLPLVNEQLQLNGVLVGNSAKLVPDATTIWSWYCVLDNQFLDKGVEPGVVVLGFGWNQLSDQSRLSPTQLGAFFCSTRDLLTINRNRTLSSAEAGEFLTASALRTYTHRQTIRNGALSTIIPHYQSTTQSINAQQRDRQDSAEPVFSYSILSSLIDALKDNNSRLIVVAIPVRDDPYEIEQGLLTVLKNREIPLLDYTNLHQIDSSSFLDDMHLKPNGAAVLSARLSKDLSVILAQPTDQPSVR